jgi:hypothetical protein
VEWLQHHVDWSRISGGACRRIDPEAPTAPGVRTCEINRTSRVAEGFLVRPRRKHGGNTPCAQRRPGQKDTQPSGREQKRPSGGVACPVAPPAAGRLRGRLPQAARKGETRREAGESTRYRDAPSQSTCHPAFSALARLILLVSQVLKEQEVRRTLVHRSGTR